MRIDSSKSSSVSVLLLYIAAAAACARAQLITLSDASANRSDSGVSVAGAPGRLAYVFSARLLPCRQRAAPGRVCYRHVHAIYLLGLVGLAAGNASAARLWEIATVRCVSSGPRGVRLDTTLLARKARFRCRFVYTLRTTDGNDDVTRARTVAMARQTRCIDNNDTRDAFGRVVGIIYRTGRKHDDGP